MILVTGGASGIGSAVIAHLETGGAKCVSFDPALPAEGGPASHFRIDVTAEDAVSAAVEDVERQVGPIIGVVNSAGIAVEAPFEKTDAAIFRRMIDINLTGTFLVCRAVAPHMRRRGGGSIVNIASVSGMIGNAGRAAYGASKGGVIAMTKVMAVELAADGVRVNAIAPGPIETAMARAMHDERARQAWTSAVPMRRYGTAEEVAHAVEFLLNGRLSSYVTGQVLCVDGGFVNAGLMHQPIVSSAPTAAAGTLLPVGS